MSARRIICTFNCPSSGRHSVRQRERVFSAMAPHKTNLVALGSAAVIAVYSAGYVRTRSAAEAMESQSAELRPKLPPLEASPVAAPVAAVALSAAPKETTVVIVDLQKKLEHPHRKRKAQGDDSAHR